MPSTAASMSASSKTTTGALPPSSRWTRLMWGAALAATSAPARTEPVIATRLGVGCSTSSRPVSRSPVMTFEGAGREELGGELGQPQGALGGGVARLEDDSVAGREGGSDLPHRHQQRVVPRRHLADD